MAQSTQHRFQLWGWILFIFSATFFIATSIRAEDPLGLIGGLLFLIACFVFLVPLLAEVGISVNSLARLRRCFRYRPGWSRVASWLWHAPGAPRMRPALEHPGDQSQRHLIRSELRFFASTR
jgi:hypothetical protein